MSSTSLSFVAFLCVCTSACRTPDPRSDLADSGSDTGPDIGHHGITEPGGPERLCQVVASCGGSILDEPKAPCTIQVVGGGGAVLYDGPAGIELRGRSSMSFPKPQYAVELRSHSELPLWPGARWRYLDAGAPPAGWREPGFDDSGWSSGPAPLGYGVDYLQTEIAPGAGGALTSWFRTEFTVGKPDAVTKLEIGIKRRDGVAVWLNGVEIARNNLASAAGPGTPALEALSEEEAGRWIQVEVDRALLADGPNVLAAEVHRADPLVEQLRFDLYLEATGDDERVDLLGMGADPDWILNGQYVDRALFRNRLAYDLFQALGGTERYATETRFCELELGGDYRGIYTLGERIERGDARLDISKGDSAGDTFVIKLDDEEGFHDNAVGYGTWQLVEPKADGADAPAAEQVISDWLVGWETAVTGPDPSDPVTGIFGWVDMDSAVDWILLQELMRNNDAYLLSVHLWREEGGKAHFVPWDLDLSLGYPADNCDAGGWLWRNAVARDGTVVPIVFVDAMAAVPAFHDALVARWRELRAPGGVLSDDAIAERIAAYDATLAPAIAENFARWPIQDIEFTAGGTEDLLCPVSSYDEEHTRTVQFIADRLAWMDENIETF